MTTDEHIAEILQIAELNLPVPSEEWRRETVIKLCRALMKAREALFKIPFYICEGSDAKKELICKIAIDVVKERWDDI